MLLDRRDGWGDRIRSGVSAPAAVVGEIARPHLVERVTAALESAGVAVLVAPHGCGKTVLVGQWARNAPRVAWLGVTAADRDPATFVRSLVRAMRTIEPDVGAAALVTIAFSGQDGPSIAIERLLDEVAALGAVTLVIDGLDVIDQSETAELADDLARRPVEVRLVLVGRSDAFVAAERFAVTGSAVEVIGHDELLFSTAEVEAVAGDRARQIIEQTAGWPRWVARALLDTEQTPRRRDANDALVEASRAIADDLTPELRAFVVDLAVLGEFTSALGSVALDRSDVVEHLDDLHRLHLVPNPDPIDGWYRLDPFVRRGGRALAMAEAPARRSQILGRAVEWCIEHDRPDLALQFTHDLGGAADARTILLRHGPAWAMNSRTGPVLDWCNRLLATDTCARDADLLLVRAWSEAQSDRVTQLSETLGAVEDIVSDADSPVDRARLAEVLVLRSHLCRRIGRFADALTLAHEAARLAPEAAALDGWIGPPDHARISLTLGMAALWAGSLEQADAVLRRTGLTLVRPAGRAVAISHQALGAWVSGRPGSAVLASIAAPLLADPTLMGPAATSPLAIVALVADAPVADGAVAHLETISAASSYVGDTVLVELALARVHARRDDTAARDACLAQVEREIASCAQPGILPALLERQRSLLSVAAPLDVSPSRFSASETLLLRGLASDATEREIAETLFLSYNTVRTYRRRIYRRLGVESRAAAVARATQLGLLAAPNS